MVDFFVERIHDGKTTLEKVPAILREEVISKYEEKYGQLTK